MHRLFLCQFVSTRSFEENQGQSFIPFPYKKIGKTQDRVPLFGWFAENYISFRHVTKFFKRRLQMIQQKNKTKMISNKRVG